MSTAVCRTSRREPGRLPPGSSGPHRLRRESGARARRPRCARAVNAARPPMRRSSPTPSVAALCAVCAAGASHAADSARFVRSHEHREWGSRRRRDGVCARPDKRSEHGPSRTHVYTFEPVHGPCVCILGLRALPKNRGSRARAIPRATPPVPHAPIPCAPPAARFAPRRGVGGDDGRPLRLSTSPASSDALEGPAEAARRRRLPRVLALAGRGSRPAASARPLPRHALPPRPSDSSTRRRGRGPCLDSRRRKGWRSLRPVSRGHTSPAVGAASASPRQRSRPALT